MFILLLEEVVAIDSFVKKYYTVREILILQFRRHVRPAILDDVLNLA